MGNQFDVQPPDGSEQTPDDLTQLEIDRENLERRIGAFRESLPDGSYGEEVEELVNSVRDLTARAEQSRWTKYAQEAAELKRRFSGKEEALHLGERLLSLPAEARSKLEHVMSAAVLNPSIDGAPGQNAPSTQGQAGPTSDPLAEARQIFEQNPDDPGAALRALDHLTKSRIASEQSEVQKQLQALQATIQQQQAVLAESVLRQKEMEYTTAHPHMSQYLDEVRERQRTVRFPNGTYFWQLPIEVQFQMVAGAKHAEQPDLMSSLAAQQQQVPGGNSRNVAAHLPVPGSASPGRRSQPETIDDAWKQITEKVSRATEISAGDIPAGMMPGG